MHHTCRDDKAGVCGTDELEQAATSYISNQSKWPLETFVYKFIRIEFHKPICADFLNPFKRMQLTTGPCTRQKNLTGSKCAQEMGSKPGLSDAHRFHLGEPVCFRILA